MAHYLFFVCTQWLNIIWQYINRSQDLDLWSIIYKSYKTQRHCTLLKEVQISIIVLYKYALYGNKTQKLILKKSLRFLQNAASWKSPIFYPNKQSTEVLVTNPPIIYINHQPLFHPTKLSYLASRELQEAFTL